MGRKRARFRITKRGKIVFTLLAALLIFALVFALRMHAGVVYSSTNPENSKTNTSVEINRQDDKTNDGFDSKDEDLLVITKSNYSESAKTSTDTSSNKKSTEPEIDEKFFSNALFIGDSITEGISAYGFLDKTNVLAVKGLTVLKAEKEMDTIVKRKPDRIYILLGSNDLLYGMDSEKFSSQYIEFIQHIKEKLPETKLYIQSIFPVSREVESKKPMLSNSRIDIFNKDLKKMAEQQGIGYIDISGLLKDASGIMNKDYTSDGIHVKYKFYSIWLDYIKRNS